MKKVFTLFLILTFCKLSLTSIAKEGCNELSQTGSTSVIDLQDTVVIDLSQAVIISNNILIPVSILSDDTIYALDFSLKYDHSHLDYDTVVNHSSYIQAFSFYNQSDSTIRFTSNSTTSAYVHDTALVSLSFFQLITPTSLSDMNTFNAYLNGDPCSVKLIDALPVSVNAFDDVIESVYPVPANELLNVHTKAYSRIKILDLSGKIVFADESVSKKFEINTSEFPAGTYFLMITGDNSVKSTRTFTVK